MHLHPGAEEEEGVGVLTAVLLPRPHALSQYTQTLIQPVSCLHIELASLAFILIFKSCMLTSKRNRLRNNVKILSIPPSTAHWGSPQIPKSPNLYFPALFKTRQLGDYPG